MHTLEAFNNLKPLFTGVATILTQGGQKMSIPVIFYVNQEDGRWMWIETDNSETCVINIGDGLILASMKKN